MAKRPSFDLQLSGNLKENLQQLPERMQKPVIRRAMLRLAQPMVSAAQANIGDSVKTGRTQQRIIVSATLSRRQRRGQVKDKNVITVYMGVQPSRKAHLIEFGSGPRYHKTGKYVGQMPASPYLRPAFDAGAQPYLQGLGRVIGEEIEKTAARWSRKQMRQLNTRASKG